MGGHRARAREAMEEVVDALLDTSVIVRYLTGDPPGLARAAAGLIESHATLHVSDVAIAEVGFVLTQQYRIDRPSVVDSMIEFLRRRNIKTMDRRKDEVIRGLELCRPSGRVSFADALIGVAVRASAGRLVYSFDDRFPADGIEVRRPG